MRIEILDKAKKKKFLEKISAMGIEKIHYLLIRTGGERIRAYSGSLTTDEVLRVCAVMPVETVGLYFGKEFELEARLSIDTLHLFSEEIKNNGKNIIKINEQQEKEWFFGNSIELNEEQQKQYKELNGFVAVESQGDFIGTGKISQDKKIIANFLPKERRVKQ
jgi:NOL1/NOP2/fmu family ribosome biogenesis protein